MANSTSDSSFSTYGLENELTGYKAISGSAIFSAVTGAMSLLMFVDYSFFFIPLLAVVFGVIALRRIKRYPGIYTGIKLAQAGIGLSVLFSLVSVSMGVAYQYLTKSEAQSYAMSLQDVLRTGRAEEILFLKVPPSDRADLTPDKLIAQRLESGTEGKMGLESDIEPLKAIVAARSVPGAAVAFEQIELSGYDKLTPFAFLRYAIQGGTGQPKTDGDGHDHAAGTIPPGHSEGDGHDHSKDAHVHKEGDGHDHGKEASAHKESDGHDHAKDGHEHKEGDGHDHAPASSAGAGAAEPTYLMVQIKSQKHEGKNAWYIAEILYPYKKGTAKPKAAKVDDGHGH